MRLRLSKLSFVESYCLLLAFFIFLNSYGISSLFIPENKIFSIPLKMYKKPTDSIFLKARTGYMSKVSNISAESDMKLENTENETELEMEREAEPERERIITAIRKVADRFRDQNRQPSKYIADTGSDEVTGGSQVIKSTTTTEEFEDLLRVQLSRVTVEYMGEIIIGSDEQSINVVFDTGSDLLCIPTQKCGEENCHESERFLTYNSKTYSDSGHLWTQFYVKGEVEGTLSTDEVSINTAKISNQRFLAVYRDLNMNNSKAAGILGLDLHSCSPSVSEIDSGICNNLKAQGLIEKGIFAFYLSQSFYSSSYITLGGWDTDLIGNRSISWINCTRAQNKGTHQVFDQKWMLPLGKVKYKGTIDLTKKNMNVIIDSGASFISMPNSSFQIIASHLFRKFNCSYVQNQYFACHINETQRDSLPPIKITLGGKELSIPPNSYLLPTTQMQEPPYLEFTPLAIIIMNESFEYYPNWVLGVTFLQNFYTIFDYDNYAIAFVRLDTLSISLQVKVALWISGIGILLGLLFVMYRVLNNWKMRGKQILGESRKMSIKNIYFHPPIPLHQMFSPQHK